MTAEFFSLLQEHGLPSVANTCDGTSSVTTHHSLTSQYHQAATRTTRPLRLVARQSYDRAREDSVVLVPPQANQQPAHPNSERNGCRPPCSPVSFNFCTWRTQRRQYAAQRTMDRRWLDPDRSSAERGPGRSTSAHRGGGGGRPAAGVGVGYWVAGFRGRLTIHPSIGLNGDDDDLT